MDIIFSKYIQILSKQTVSYHLGSFHSFFFVTLPLCEFWNFGRLSLCYTSVFA